MNIARADTSLLGRWWWTVDHWTLAALGCLIGFGAVLAMAATPAVATRIGLDPFFFVRRQIGLLIPAIAIMVAISMMSARTVRLVAMVGFAISTTLLAATFFIGSEIKGARRWIHVPGLSIQPSEFVKPTFTIVAAWLFAMQRKHERFPGDLISIGLYLLVLALLLLQPDVGMSIVITSVWFAQFFLAGLRMFWVVLLGGSGLVSLVGAYFVFPHVASRVDRFLDPASGDNYQVSTALDAFLNGGLFGRGPGEGTVKSVLPDAHSDFVFAVAGEEFGLIACIVVVALFAFIVLRGFARVLQDSNLFILLAVAGLLAQFGLQALINMSSTLNIIPTKGMTLPFISYGGSSLLALALGMGFVLALTRKRFGPGERDTL
jgi:cell division protein FtsW